jgi:DNA-binding MarR family transcriptional regulator
MVEAAAPPRLTLWSRPGYLIRRLHQIHSSLFFEECKGFNITPVQYGILTALHHRPGSDQVSLGAELGIDRTNAADVLERLAERGLVRRERSQRDRRSMIAFITRKGETVMTDMFARMQRSQERLLAPLAAELQPAFLAMIVQIIEGNNKYGRTLLRSEFDLDGGRGGRRRARSQG